MELKELGWKQCDVAEAFGVTPAAVSRWVAKVRAYGQEAWRAQPRSRGPLKLGQEQWQLLPDLLAHGAQAYGFRGEVWTCARVTRMIRQVFGVSYHKAHVSRLLQQLGWTPQIPSERANETRNRSSSGAKKCGPSSKKGGNGRLHPGVCG